ncbi:MAG TPA: hypothetical protein VFN21_04140 [Acidimicrobiales bacterium]|nr:hypothetical protein [Acidimicrobiales bacterium]
MTDPADNAERHGRDFFVETIDEVRGQVPAIDPDTLVHRVRGRMGVRARRRRRTVRLVVGSGAAAAVLVTLVAISLRSGDSTSTARLAMRDIPRPGEATSSAAFTADAEPGKVSVDPSSGLSDGSIVQVTAYGFDPGTPVEFFQCLSATDLPGLGPSPVPGTSPTRWICQGRLGANGALAKVSTHAVQLRDSNGPVSAPDRHLTRSTTPFTVAEAGDPLVSIALDGTISVQRWVLGADIAIPRCGPTPPDPYRGPTPTPPEQPTHIRPCVIVGVGAFDGELRAFASEPLVFASARSG